MTLTFQLLGVILAAVVVSPVVASTSKFAVAGYLPEWRFLQWTPEEHKWRWNALSKHLTHLILFSLEIGADGSFQAMDRFPPTKTMQYARSAARKHDTKLLICFGGNARTNGFPTMVAKKKTRATFIKKLIKFCKKHKLHGVDYNWEYPKTAEDWKGLWQLIKETRAYANKAELPDFQITMAYYPDKRQEAEIAKGGAVDSLDLIHMMSYDQHQKHSTWEFGKQAVDQGVAVLPAAKLTMGLPMYARNIKTGEWTTYEDIIKIKAPKELGPLELDPDLDIVGQDYFNGVNMIKKKTLYALEQNLGGVMIWESGQDHFVNDRSCLNEGTSLHIAITNATEAFVGQQKDEL